MVTGEVSQKLLGDQQDDKRRQEGIAHLKAGDLLGIEYHVGRVVHLEINTGELPRKIGPRGNGEVAFARGYIHGESAVFQAALRRLKLHFIKTADGNILELGD